MNGIGIVTEETVDLLPETLDKYDIKTVPAVLIWPKLEPMPGANTFQKMRALEKSGDSSFGKTSQPNPGDFLAGFNRQLGKYNQVICITLTSRLSGSHNSAVLARNLIDERNRGRILIVDSQSASCGQALVVLKALELIESGLDFIGIVKQLEEFAADVHLFVMFPDIRWVEASGRISAVVANIMRGMSRVGIRPVLTFKHGELALASLKIRATDMVEVLHRQLVKDSEEARKAGRHIKMAITHGDDIGSALKLKWKAEQLDNFEVVLVNLINNVIGVLTGPDALAFAWCES